jgi:hypothetical protein
MAGARNTQDPARWERLLSEERRALLNPGSFLDPTAVEPAR